MSMTEREIFEAFKRNYEEAVKNIEILNIAITHLTKCLDEYREIGTVEELKSMKENGAFSALEMAQIIAKMNKLKEFEAIGTVSEFAELKEKATAKKPIYSDFDENEDEEIIPYKAVCPVCGYEFEFGTWNDEQNHHCECGQRMLWD